MPSFVLLSDSHQRNDLIMIVAILFGLYGGLTTSLKLIVPFSVFSFYKAMQRRKHTLQVTVEPRRPSNDHFA